MIKTILVLVSACMISSTALADIYESDDAEGEPVFTDTPQPGAEKIDLPKANTADPVATPSEVEASSGEKSNTDQSNIVVIPDSHNQQVEAAEAEDRRHDVREAEKRHEVLEAEPTHDKL